MWASELITQRGHRGRSQIERVTDASVEHCLEAALGSARRNRDNVAEAMANGNEKADLVIESRFWNHPRTKVCTSTTRFHTFMGEDAPICCRRVSKVWKRGRSLPRGPPARVSSRREIRVGYSSARLSVTNAHLAGWRRSRSMPSHCAASSVARSACPGSPWLPVSRSALTKSASVSGMRPMFRRVNRSRRVQTARCLVPNHSNQHDDCSHDSGRHDSGRAASGGIVGKA